jgi:hypothetical protein
MGPLLDARLRATIASMQTVQHNRLVLVGPARHERETKIRRYRLARLKLEDRDEREPRFAHLKRVYD